MSLRLWRLVATVEAVEPSGSTAAAECAAKERSEESNGKKEGCLKSGAAGGGRDEW